MTNKHGSDKQDIKLFVTSGDMDFRNMLKHREYEKWKKKKKVRPPPSPIFSSLPAASLSARPPTPHSDPLAARICRTLGLRPLRHSTLN